MSEQVQLPPTQNFAPRVTPVRAPDPIEPPKKSQADNRNANDHRSGGDGSAPEGHGATDRQLTITREPALQSFVYRSIDSDSGEVVWQYPTEQVLRRARHWRDMEEKRQNELDEKA